MFSVVGEYAKQEFAYTDIIGQDIGETARLTECLRSGAKIPCRGRQCGWQYLSAFV